MLVPMKKMLEKAMEEKYGIGAFNVNNMEQIQAIMKAAKELNSPVILQASRGALKYSDFNYLKHLMLAAEEENPEIKISMHLDHGNSLETCKKAIELGFTSVMIDGSLKEDGKTPTTYGENAEVTKKVVDFAHAHGVSVEGELGTLGGIEDGVGSGQINLTDPEQAKEFIQETGVDALAVAIGTSHGAYKFKKEPKLALELVEKIAKENRIPLVMHGSSSIPKELVERINKYGGSLGNAMGVPIPQIQDAIELGICKVNVDSDSRLAMTGAIRQVLSENPAVFDPRAYLKEARKAMYHVIKSKILAFGSAGKN